MRGGVKLFVLGSGSSGNCLVVEAEGERLLVDAGIGPDARDRADAGPRRGPRHVAARRSASSSRTITATTPRTRSRSPARCARRSSRTPACPSRRASASRSAPYAPGTTGASRPLRGRGARDPARRAARGAARLGGRPALRRSRPTSGTRRASCAHLLAGMRPGDARGEPLPATARGGPVSAAPQAPRGGASRPPHQRAGRRLRGRARGHARLAPGARASLAHEQLPRARARRRRQARCAGCLSRPSSRRAAQARGRRAPAAWPHAEQLGFGF